jgi:hypothetical protein
MGIADVIAVLRLDASNFNATLGETSAKLDALSKSGSSSMEKLASVGKAAFEAIGAGAVAVGVAAVDFGDKLEASNASMAQSFKNAGTSVAPFQAQISAIDSQFAKYGYTAAQTNDVISRMVGATGNAKGALGDMGVVADIAAARHMDLATAGDLVTKTMSGNITAAKRMGVEIPPAILAIKDPTEKADAVLKILSERFGGQASKSAKTFGGQLAAVKAQGENLLASIGLKLIPILEDLMKITEKIVGWLEKHKMVAAALGVVIGGVLLAAMGAWTISLFAAGGALAFLMSPITLIVAGVALLVAGIVLLATHWQQVWGDIKRWVEDAWHFIDGIFHDIANAVLVPIDFIKTHWQLLLAILTGPIGLAVLAIKDHWNTIRTDVSKLIDDIVTFFTGLPGKILAVLTNIVTTIMAPLLTAGTWITTNVIQPVVAFFTALPGQIVAALGSIVTTIWSGLTTAGTWIDTNVIQPVVAFFKALPGNIVTALGDIVTTIWAGLTKAATWIDTNVIQPVIAFFKALPGNVATAIGDFFTTAWAALTKVASWLDTNVWTPVSTWFGAIPAKVAVVITGFWDTAFHDLTTIGTWLENHVWKPMESFFSGLPERIAKAAGNILGKITGSITGGISGILSSINPFAVGGIVNGPTLAIVGEAGPEAILPLSDPARMAQILGQIQPLGSSVAGSNGSAMGAAGPTIGTYAPTVTINGTGLSAAQVTTAIQNALSADHDELIRTLNAA